MLATDAVPTCAKCVFRVAALLMKAAACVQGKLKSMQINMNAVGRSVDEALRLLDAFQYVAEHGVVCPANWQPGDETMEADPDGSQKYFAQVRCASARGQVIC